MGDEFEDPSKWFPVVLALILIYFTTIQSFVDYHRASEDQPYQLLNTEKRRSDLLRFYLDIVIVGIYSFMLLKCHALLKAPGANVTPVFFAFVMIFFLYVLWGCLREKTGNEKTQSFSIALLLVVLIIYAVISFAYTRIIVIDWQVNTVFFFIALYVMVVYRIVNWIQND